MAAVVFLLIVTQAFPQRAPQVNPPWTVVSEFIRYADDGSSSIEMYSTSYSLNGDETLLSRSMPGNPFTTALGRALDVAQPAWGRLISPLTAAHLEKLHEIRRSQPHVSFITGCGTYVGCLVLEHFGWLKPPAGSGDGCIDKPIVARETILNHPTAAVQARWTEHGKMTLWTAPDLKCFALRVTYENQRSDGSFHLVAAKQAIKITANQ